MVVDVISTLKILSYLASNDKYQKDFDSRVFIEIIIIYAKFPTPRAHNKQRRHSLGTSPTSWYFLWERQRNGSKERTNWISRTWETLYVNGSILNSPMLTSNFIRSYPDRRLLLKSLFESLVSESWVSPQV